jgi:hypothetical protein
VTINGINNGGHKYTYRVIANILDYDSSGIKDRKNFINYSITCVPPFNGSDRDSFHPFYKQYQHIILEPNEQVSRIEGTVSENDFIMILLDKICSVDCISSEWKQDCCQSKIIALYIQTLNSFQG